MSPMERKNWQFSGRWIGETQDCPSNRPAHIWEITERGTWADIDNLWEGDPQFRTMTAQLVPDQAAIELSENHQAIMVDPQHFVIVGWDAITENNQIVAEYDVIFSRPGIAELTAHQVWRDWKKKQPPPDTSPASKHKKSRAKNHPPE
jgi:hypothetical protein